MFCIYICSVYIYMYIYVLYIYTCIYICSVYIYTCIYICSVYICHLYVYIYVLYIYIHSPNLSVYIYMFTIIKEQLIANIYGTHVCNPLLAPLKGCPSPPWTLPWNLKIWKNFSLAFPNSSWKLFPAVLVSCSCLKEG